MDELPALFQDIEFRMVWKGYDSDEVDAYVDRVAKAAALVHGRVSELQQRAESAEIRAAAGDASSASGETEATLTRTLILAQRTADAAIAEAKAEAAQLIASAEGQAQIALGEAESAAAATIKDADDHASRVNAEAQTDRRTLLAETEAEAVAIASSEHERVANEVAELERYRAFLVDDVDLLEQHLCEQRTVLATSVSVLSDLVERPETFRVDQAPATSGVVPPEAASINLDATEEVGAELDSEELAEEIEVDPTWVEAEIEPMFDAITEPEAFAPSVLEMPPVVAVDGDVEFVELAPIEESVAELAPESPDSVENQEPWTAAVAAWDEPMFAPETDEPSPIPVDVAAGIDTSSATPSTFASNGSPGPVFDPQDLPTRVGASMGQADTASTLLDEPAPPLLVTAADFEPFAGDGVESGEVMCDEPTAPIPVVQDLLFADGVEESDDPFLSQLRDAVAFDEVDLGDDALAAFFDHDDNAASRGWFGRKR
jgi:DivIVA domain-containing protein